MLIENCGKFRNLNLIFIGEKGKDSYGAYLEAERKSDGKIIKGPEVTLELAKAEKWTTNPKWLTLTELMVSYRSYAFFARVYCPEALLGLQTTEEITDVNEEKPVSEVKDIL